MPARAHGWIAGAALLVLAGAVLWAWNPIEGPSEAGAPASPTGSPAPIAVRRAAPDRDASNEAWIDHLDALASTYGRTPVQAGSRRVVEAALLQALALTTREGDAVTRLPVQLHAARIVRSLAGEIPAMQRGALEAGLRRTLDESTGRRPGPAITVEGLRTLFGALVSLRGEDTLAWLADRFIHTDTGRTDEVRAAQEAMQRLEGAPGEQRRRTVDALLATYTAVEVIVEADASSDRARELRPFWAEVGPGALALLNHLAGRGSGDGARPFASFAEAAAWMRGHRDPRDAPHNGR